MIDGVKIIPLRQIVDERGKIMHMMKATDPHFIRFGEIYFSCAWPGVVKAWHVHKSMTINNAVLSGRAKLVMYDLREESPTRGELQEVFFGEDNYCSGADAARHRQRLQGVRRQNGDSRQLRDRAARSRRDDSHRSIHLSNSVQLEFETWLNDGNLDPGIIMTRTPLRVSFAGGGTDLADFYEREPGAVFSTAINKYIYVTVKRHGECFQRIHPSELFKKRASSEHR